MPPRAERIWEEPLGQGSLLSFPQKLGGAVGEQDRPLSCIGLSLPHCQLPALTGADGAAYLERPGLPVEVLPPEPAQLPPPQAGGQLRVEEVPPGFVLVHCRQEGIHLLIVQDAHGFVCHLGRLHMVSGIVWQQPLVYGGFQRMVEGGVDAVDGGGG